MKTYFVMKKGMMYSARENVSPDDLKAQYQACQDAGLMLVADSVEAESEADAIRHVKSLSNWMIVLALTGMLNAMFMLFVGESPVNVVIMFGAVAVMFGMSGKARAIESEALKALRKNQ
ncbi:hypothetical protein KDD30_09495 [Photobacterium sp. GJ3]|uniref:hypothetical protein n=1 Tax=Photobacterium sp. GJ3 TaxID=2829502 RepID=UPI001B8BC08E|nr:hypothetical protein [Photobacterium sp. GJ3]QUJ66412.1 hypothetical protein KDD30_09495 [Photobacterium sp. GJ3]